QRDVVTGAGLFFIAYAISMFVMRSYLGKLQDRRGDNVVIYFGLLFFIASFVVLALSTANWHVVVAGVLAGLGYGTLMPALLADSLEFVVKSEFCFSFSTVFLFVILVMVFYPVFVGSIASVICFGPMYGVLAVVGGIPAIKDLCTHAHT